MAGKDKMHNNSIESDLERILIRDLWEELRGASIFLTGGTGFFGRWFLESFVRANDAFNLNASVMILTRSFDDFKKKAPHLTSNSSIRAHVGDVRDFAFPEGEYSHIIHAATTNAVATFNNEDPLIKFDTTAQGTRRTLDFAVRCKARKFLMTSSGSVYGKAPSGMTHITEDYSGAPLHLDFVNYALGEGKRVAEFLCAYYARKYSFDVQIARCFSFVGPYQPLNIHYAIGNFIRDALFSEAITINGNGAPMRSYMYLGDLVVWLLTLLVKGSSGRVYNVGSDQAVSIRELAYLVRDTLSPRKKVQILGQVDAGVGGDWYVPNIQRARSEFGLDVCTPLSHAIQLTAKAVVL